VSFPRFVARIQSVFEQELAAAKKQPATAEELGKSLDAFFAAHKRAMEKARHSDTSALTEAQALAKRVLGGLDKTTAALRPFGIAALRYLVRRDDGLVDNDEFMGLEDDLEVLQAAARALGV